MAKDGNIKGWITIKGVHIPILEGQSKAQAAKQFIYQSKKQKKNQYKKEQEDKKLINKQKELANREITDEEALEAYCKSSYRLNKEAGWIDKDTSYDEFKNNFVKHEGNMNYFRDNKESMKNEVKRDLENKLKTFDQLSDRSKSKRYKEASLKYTCGNYIDMLNYQQGKKVKGDIEEVKRNVEALEYMSTKGGFDISYSMYRGLKDIPTDNLKPGNIIAMRPTLSSWTDDIDVAKRFSGDNKNAVIMINKNGRYGDIDYYSNSLRQESECIMSSTRNKFKITDIKKEGNITYVYTDQSFYKEEK